MCSHFLQELYNMVGMEYFPPTGMENQGLSTYQLSNLAGSLDTHTDSEVQANQQLVAHEYLHEWSGTPNFDFAFDAIRVSV
jgi:aminopeptidase N